MIDVRFECGNCGHMVEINEGEELIDYENDPCGFCIDGKYGKPFFGEL